MRTALKILNMITIILSLIYIIFTHQVYQLLIKITGNTTNEIYTLSKIPYYLIWITIIVYIVGNIVMYILAKYIKKHRITISIGPSEIIIVLLFLATLLLTPPFEFLEHYNTGESYPESVRYDKLFVYNDFYSNEGDYEGGYGDIKYLYIPIGKKMIYFTPDGIKTYSIKFKESNVVKIGNKEYIVHKKWFTES